MVRRNENYDLSNDSENDPFLHSKSRHFCSDDTCPCREDQDNVNTLNGQVIEGLASVGDANNIYHGRVV